MTIIYGVLNDFFMALLPEYPKIAGQNAKYAERQMLDIKSGDPDTYRRLADRLLTEDGQEYAQPGTLQFADVTGDFYLKVTVDWGQKAGVL